MTRYANIYGMINKTGKVMEFSDEIIEQRQRVIAAEHGLELFDHRLVMGCD